MLPSLAQVCRTPPVRYLGFCQVPDAYRYLALGWYGLVAARTYLRVRPNVNLMIIDSDSTVGGVWSEKRLYPNLVAQVNLGLFNYIDTPMSPEGMNNKRQVTGRMIHNYLQKYAEEHDLLRHIRFNTHVEKVERGPRGWRLHFKDSTDILDAGKLMVGTGVTSIPSMPEYLAEDVQVPIIHSRDLGESFNDLKSSKYKHVMVIGAAKSAYDAVYLLLTMGKKVTWVIRPGGSGPLAILPSELLGFWTSIGVASTRLMTGLSPSILNTKGLAYSIFQSNMIGRWLTGKFWDTVAYLSDRHAGYDKGDHVAGLRPEIDGKRLDFLLSHLNVTDVSIVSSGQTPVLVSSLYQTFGARFTKATSQLFGMSCRPSITKLCPSSLASQSTLTS